MGEVVTPIEEDHKQVMVVEEEEEVMEVAIKDNMEVLEDLEELALEGLFTIKDIIQLQEVEVDMVAQGDMDNNLHNNISNNRNHYNNQPLEVLLLSQLRLQLMNG